MVSSLISILFSIKSLKTKFSVDAEQHGVVPLNSILLSVSYVADLSDIPPSSSDTDNKIELTSSVGYSSDYSESTASSCSESGVPNCM